MNKRNKKNGYSVIEILVYLAIFTSISALVINLFITILSSLNVTNANRRLVEAGQISMDRISREIRQAQSIDASSTSDSLILNGDNLINFRKENNELNLYKNGSLEGSLISDDVSVINLVFRPISTVESQAVKIEMNISYSKGGYTKSENFYNTIVLRGGY